MVRRMRVGERFCSLISIFVLCCVGLFGPGRVAHAEEAPSLTVQVLRAPAAAGNGGMQTLIPDEGKPVGEGYVFKLQQLDARKINEMTNRSPAELTEGILRDPQRFAERNASCVYGVTDADGRIMQSLSAGPGTWVAGSMFDARTGAVSAGEPAVFTGTAQRPTYWLMTMVYAPDATVHVEPALVELPYEAEGRLVWDVHVYPKSSGSTHVPAVPKQPQRSTPGRTALTGVGILAMACVAVALLVVGALAVAIDHGRRGSADIEEGEE